MSCDAHDLSKDEGVQVTEEDVNERKDAAR
jgi:hypothetical protein